MNDDMNLEFRVRALEHWASTLEDDLKNSAVILREADATIERLSVVIEKLRKNNEH